jgi:hypothetical protein
LQAGRGIVAPQGKKLFSIDGEAAPLLWADGIMRIEELDAYKRTGLNTVVVRLSWRPTPDGAIVPEDLAPQRQFAEEAARRGLQVIYSLPPTPFGMEQSFRTNADSVAYFTLWTAWTQEAIARLKDTPNLIGWMLPDDPRGLPYFDEVGWSKWVDENYAGIGVINKQWGVQFEDIGAVTLENTNRIISDWRGSVIPESLTNEDIAERVLRSNKRPENQNFAFHPAALAQAVFKWDAYRNLLRAWSEVVRDSDPQHAILSGRLPDYAQLLSVPEGIDVTVADIRPGVAENDVITHNPQSVDIARRGGRFMAIATLTTEGSTAVAPEMLPMLLPKWADAAFAHGASGLAFTSWSALQENTDLLNALQSTLERLQTPRFTPLWQQAPVATAAVLLTPLADGHTLNIGERTPVLPRGLYGFGDNMIAGEPSDLVFALRWGTAFGSVDYLSPDDIGSPQVPLSRYNVLLMPQALSVDSTLAAQIGNYVQNGGVAVADLGVGAMQAGGQVIQVTPYISQLFGMAPFMPMKTVAFNLQLLEAHPLLPTWNTQLAARRNPVVTGGAGPNNTAFAGPVCYGDPLPGTTLLALGHQIFEQLGRSSNGAYITRPMRASLLSRPLGRGHLFFAPWRLWTHWRPGYSGFDGFHGDLMSQGAALVETGAQSMVPAPATGNGMPQYPQVMNYANGIALLNHLLPRTSNDPNAPMQGLQIARVQTAGVGDFLWSNAVATLNGGEQNSVVGGRPAPIANPDEWESRPHPVTLQTTVRPGESKMVQLRPIRAQNLGGGPLSSSVLETESSKLRVVLWPNATEVMALGEEMQMVVAEPSPVRVTVYDDANGYRVAPNSRHRVNITSIAAPTQTADSNKKPVAPLEQVQTYLVVADAQGHLKIESNGAALLVEVTPQG